jgi:hypothetical protein
MDKKTIKVGNVVTLEDGREVKITQVNPDLSFEWDLVHEEKEDLKGEVKEKAPKETKSKKVIKKTEKDILVG